MDNTEQKTNILTWDELKTFCNSLTKEQLAKPVIWIGDERGGKINFADTAEEDYVSTDPHEPCVLRSEYTPEQMEDNPDPEVIHEKGTPLLWTDF